MSFVSIGHLLCATIECISIDCGYCKVSQLCNIKIYDLFLSPGLSVSLAHDTHTQLVRKIECPIPAVQAIWRHLFGNVWNVVTVAMVTCSKMGVVGVRVDGLALTAGA